MNISLRKANAVQNEIKEKINSYNAKITPTISLNEFQNCEHEIQKAYTATAQAFSQVMDLYRALYAIRKEVARANVQCGISDKLADIEFRAKEINTFSTLAVKGNVRQTKEVLEGRLEKLRNNTNDIYGYNRDGVTTGIFSEELIEMYNEAISSNKKMKQKLQDQILELNIKTEINLPLEVVAILEKENIL